MPVGDGGPDGPLSSALDFEGTGTRSWPNEIEVMESSLRPRIGEAGRSGARSTGAIFSAVAADDELRLVAIFSGDFDFENLWAS